MPRTKELKNITEIHFLAPPPRLPMWLSMAQVKQGDTVKQGQPLLVLSAMKMETNVASPIDGVVTSLLVKDGDSVQGNDLVVELEL